jgi:hypothetical protein
MVKTWRRRSDHDGLQKLAIERPTRSVRKSEENRVTSYLTCKFCVDYNFNALGTQGRNLTIQLLNIYNMLNEIVPNLVYLASHTLLQ